MSAQVLSFRDQQNAKYCKRDGAGNFLCTSCEAVLGQTNIIDCEACRAVAKQRQLAEQEQRELDQWRKRTLDYCNVSYDKLPPWDWARHDQPLFIERARKPFLRAAQKWAPSMGNLVLLGLSGSGKTAAAVAALWRLRNAAESEALAGPVTRQASPALARLRGMLATTAHDVAKARRQAPLGQDEAPLVLEAMHASVLYLDELGFEVRNDEVIFEVLDHRYRKSLPTIVTSGCTMAQLEAKYGAGCWRRITHGALVLECWE